MSGLSGRTIAQGPKVLEGIESSAVAVVPYDVDRVGSDARDDPGLHVLAHALEVKLSLTGRFIDAHGAGTGESKVTDVVVVALSILPEDRQRSRVAPPQPNRMVKESPNLCRKWAATVNAPSSDGD